MGEILQQAGKVLSSQDKIIIKGLLDRTSKK
jgi:hypothetical protein